MYIAYLIPRHDAHLAYEDGLAFVAVGETREAAIAKVKEQFDAALEDEAPDLWDKIVTDHEDKSDAIHVQEV